MFCLTTLTLFTQ